MSSDIVERLRELFYPDQIEWEAADAIERLRADLAAERAECDEQAALVTAWRGVADGLYGSVDPDFMVGPAVAAYLDLRDKARQ